jgi:hypothetical protein
MRGEISLGQGSKEIDYSLNYESVSCKYVCNLPTSFRTYDCRSNNESRQ